MTHTHTHTSQTSSSFLYWVCTCTSRYCRRFPAGGRAGVRGRQQRNCRPVRGHRGSFRWRRKWGRGHRCRKTWCKKRRERRRTIPEVAKLSIYWFWRRRQRVEPIRKRGRWGWRRNCGHGNGVRLNRQPCGFGDLRRRRRRRRTGRERRWLVTCMLLMKK